MDASEFRKRLYPAFIIGAFSIAYGTVIVTGALAAYWLLNTFFSLMPSVIEAIVALPLMVIEFALSIYAAVVSFIASSLIFSSCTLLIGAALLLFHPRDQLLMVAKDPLNYMYILKPPPRIGIAVFLTLSLAIGFTLNFGAQGLFENLYIEKMERIESAQD